MPNVIPEQLACICFSICALYSSHPQQLCQVTSQSGLYTQQFMQPFIRKTSKTTTKKKQTELIKLKTNNL